MIPSWVLGRCFIAAQPSILCFKLPYRQAFFPLESLPTGWILEHDPDPQEWYISYVIRVALARCSGFTCQTGNVQGPRAGFVPF